MTTQAKVDLKIITLGDVGVGKTCLVQRYVQDQFVNNTVSVSNFRKSEREGTNIR
jgi:GTPase SAR1 family protein